MRLCCRMNSSGAMTPDTHIIKRLFEQHVSEHDDSSLGITLPIEPTFR